MSITAKIKKALAATLEDGAIYLDMSECFAFAHKGAQTFLDNLVPTLTTAEKCEFLSDYVMTFSDSQVIDLCDSLTGEFNSLRIAGHEAAQRILEAQDSQSYLDEEKAYLDALLKPSPPRTPTFEQSFNSVFGGEV